MRPCLDCGLLTARTRCPAHQRAKKRPYHRASYRRQPAYGTCHICGREIEPGQGSRDHLVPLSVDPSSTRTLPAHRDCNSRRGDTPLQVLHRNSPLQQR